MNFSESLALKAVSLLLALILWITIIGFKREEVIRSVGFEPQLPPGIVIVNKIPRQIQYTFSGPRLGLKRLGEMLPDVLRPDWKHLGASSLHEIPIGEEILGKLRDGVRVVSIYPSKVYVRLEELVERTVSVKITLKGEPREGFAVTRVRASPQRVAISGPKSLLDGMESVDTEPIDVEGIDHAKEGVVGVDLSTSQGLLRVSGENSIRVRVSVRAAN